MNNGAKKFDDTARMAMRQRLDEHGERMEAAQREIREKISGSSIRRFLFMHRSDLKWAHLCDVLMDAYDKGVSLDHMIEMVEGCKCKKNSNANG